VVGLTVTETVFDKELGTEQLLAPTKREAIEQWLRLKGDRRFEPVALCSLLALHDDLRIGGPTWDMRFQFSFIP
jgi:hypothetical protein